MLHSHRQSAGDPPPGQGAADMSMGSAPAPGAPGMPPSPSSGVTVPSVAQSRLQHASQAGSASASFSNYSEHLLLDQMGFDPLGAVIGLSVVHIGRLQLAGIKQPVELDAYTQAISIGLLNALSRLQQEAELLGADGVLLKSSEEQRIDGEEHQYSLSGTAVRFRPQPGALRTAGGAPFVCPAPVITLYEMLRRGFAPVTLAYGVCVYHVPHRTLRQALGQTFQNVEVPVFTEGWYTAREIALSRVEAQAEQARAELILDLVVGEEAEVFGEHTAEFRAVGAGWSRRAGIEQVIPEIDLAAASILTRGGAFATVGLSQPAAPGAAN